MIEGLMNDPALVISMNGWGCLNLTVLTILWTAFAVFVYFKKERPGESK